MVKQDTIECTHCGAALTFTSGTNHLSCHYCGNEQTIEQSPTAIQELDIDAYEEEIFDQQATVKISTVKCSNCSAETTLGNTLASKNCPFCSVPLVIEQAKIQRLHKPQSILPFLITEKKAVSNFSQWIKGLWFAPSALKKHARHNNKLQGIYLPFWTYDSATSSTYTGQRGTTYTSSDTKGNRTTHVRWRYVSGSVSRQFDDVLVCASQSLPKKKLDALEPWDLHHLKPFDSRFLTGFKTENYQISLKQGFIEAKKKMSLLIERRIKNDIGGDRQKINSVHTQYNNTTFKHILLPCWVSAYQFNGKTYQFIVNARTGEVQGERPFSIIKITLALLLTLALGSATYTANETYKRSETAY